MKKQQKEQIQVLPYYEHTCLRKKELYKNMQVTKKGSL